MTEIKRKPYIFFKKNVAENSTKDLVNVNYNCSTFDS